MCELPWKSGRGKLQEGSSPQAGGGTAKAAQGARKDGETQRSLQEFTDAQSDSGTDGRTVRAQPPLPLPISRSLQPCYGMRGFVITLLDVLHTINNPGVLNSGWKERRLHPAPSWKLC